MGLKHMNNTQKIITESEVPMTKEDIFNKYKEDHNVEINRKTLNESLEHLLKEKKIKTTEMRIWKRDRVGYKLVD